MPKPPSIRTFETLYLGSLALWAINTALFWSRTQQIMAQSPQMQANPQIAAMIPTIMIGTIAVGAVLSLLFWFLVARQASLVGKWLVVVTEALGALSAVLAILRLVQGRAPNVPMVLIGLVVTALGVAAAVVLFRPDARAWFGEEEDEDETTLPPARTLP